MVTTPGKSSTRRKATRSRPRVCVTTVQVDGSENSGPVPMPGSMWCSTSKRKLMPVLPKHTRSRVYFLCAHSPKMTQDPKPRSWRREAQDNPGPQSPRSSYASRPEHASSSSRPPVAPSLPLPSSPPHTHTARPLHVNTTTTATTKTVRVTSHSPIYRRVTTSCKSLWHCSRSSGNDAERHEGSLSELLDAEASSQVRSGNPHHLARNRESIYFCSCAGLRCLFLRWSVNLSRKRTTLCRLQSRDTRNQQKNHAAGGRSQ